MTAPRYDYTQYAPMRLILDFIGPFVVNFWQGAVQIHAPLCADHFINVLTDRNDVFLPGLSATAKPGFVYKLTGPTGHSGKFNCHDPHNCPAPNEILILQKPLANPIPPEISYMVLQAPVPDGMVPLLPEQIFMHRNGSDTWVNTVQTHANNDPNVVNESRATALRFIYENSSAPAIDPVTSPGLPKGTIFDLENLDATARGYYPPQYHITLRLASRTTDTDALSEDAYSCFHALRALVPGAGAWRADFDNPAKFATFTFLHGGTSPADCKGNVVVAPPSN